MGIFNFYVSSPEGNQVNGSVSKSCSYHLSGPENDSFFKAVRASAKKSCAEKQGLQQAAAYGWLGKLLVYLGNWWNFKI